MSENRPKHCPVCGTAAHHGSCLVALGSIVRFLTEQQASLERRVLELELEKREAGA